MNEIREFSEPQKPFSKEDILKRISAALNTSETENLDRNCVSFVFYALGDDQNELWTQPNDKHCKDLLSNYSIIGYSDSKNYDLALATKAKFIVFAGRLANQNDSQLGYYHLALVDPEDPTFVYQREGTGDPVTRVKGTKVWADAQPPKGVVHRTIYFG